jgi:adenosine 3'-phospho 5'-phosphosulfate transporter B3
MVALSLNAPVVARPTARVAVRQTRTVARAAAAPMPMTGKVTLGARKQMSGVAVSGRSMQTAAPRRSLKCNAAGVPKAAPGEKKQVFGLTLPDNEGIAFVILAAGSLGSALGFAALQEGVFRIPGFKFSAWMTVLTTFTYFLCGALEMKLTNDTRKGSWKNYGILSVYTYGGMALTNYALSYLNYATRIVFKSAKIIPVMAFSVLIVGKQYNWKEWLSAAILVAGIVLFTLGDVASSPAFAPIGVALIAGALCIDAICANFEEKNFFRTETPSTTQEVLCFASLIGTVYGLVPLLASGKLAPAIAHSMQYTQVVPMIMGFSVLGYSSVSFILSLIKYYGATEAEIIKSLRKVLSIVISFMLFPKELNWKYIAGFAAVLVSTIYTFYLKNEKNKAKAAAAAAEAK